MFSKEMKVVGVIDRAGEKTYRFEWSFDIGSGERCLDANRV